MRQAQIMQQDIGDPPNVAGWPAYYQVPMFYEIWINSSKVINKHSGEKYAKKHGTEKLSKAYLDFLFTESGQEIILFIDELHLLIGAGKADGAMDASNLLKPALARGDLHCIGATTLDEYRKYIERDPALERRFQQVYVGEPSVENTISILRGLKEKYEVHHKIRIQDSALVAAAKLSHRYITNRQLPDKAIDLLDASCARERVKDAGTVSITADLIQQQLSRVVNVPVDRLKNERSTNIMELEGNIKQKLYGQDDAVDSVLERVYINFSGIGNNKRPIASFLFLGPTGTGKTELARLLADNLDMKLLKYDMSEYQERHSVSSLIGAPPGYVGFEDGNVGGGKLIADISKHPFSILLFDEIEKAHPDVTNILLQMLDEGVITSSNGKKANCKNTIIIMTSNLGARDSEANNIGFGDFEKTGEDDRAVKEFFKPELRNRIDQVCKFSKLDTLAVKKVVVKFVNEVNELLAEKSLKIRLTEAAVDHLAEVGYDAKMGARPLARKINELIKVPLSKKILFENVAGPSLIEVDYNGEFTFAVTESLPATQPTIDSNGYIVLDSV